MKVAKWGNSLAVRLPVAVVELMQLKEGDEVEIRLSAPGELAIGLDSPRNKALERLRKFQIDFPPNYKFDRDEANGR